MRSRKLQDKIQELIEINHLVPPNSHLVVGVSGGADSVCLLKLLFDLKDEFGLKLTAVHMNHSLRGHESDADQAFVEGLCKRLEIPLRIFQRDIYKISKQQKLSLEDAGRRERYQAFEQVMQEEQADFIAVAHHWGDNAETVMLNILRGCGIEGLGGMSLKSSKIIRPLLNVSRQEIIHYLEDCGVGYREDSSNSDSTFIRNRVRNLLFPFIKENFPFDPSSALNRLAELAAIDNDLMESMAQENYDDVLRKQAEEYVQLDLKKLSSLHAAISSRIIRLAWEKLNGNRKNLEQVHVQAVLKLCRDYKTGKQVKLPALYQARVSYDNLYIEKESENKMMNFSYPVIIPGYTFVKELKGCLKASIMDQNKADESFFDSKESAFGHLFDYGKLKRGINIRNRLEGDRLQPKGLNGEKKLKEYFIDKKVPAGERSMIPLVAVGNTIVWVVGMRTSAQFRADQNTKELLLLEWVECGDGGNNNE